MVESCERTANLISLKGADAVLGWEVFESWDPERIQRISLKPDALPQDEKHTALFAKLTAGPIGMSTFTTGDGRLVSLCL